MYMNSFRFEFSIFWKYLTLFVPLSLGSEAISLLVKVLGLYKVVRAFGEQALLHEDAAVEQLFIDFDDFCQLSVDLSDLLDLRVKGVDLLGVEVQN